jgi:hypothetical protein
LKEIEYKLVYLVIVSLKSILLELKFNTTDGIASNEAPIAHLRSILVLAERPKMELNAGVPIEVMVNLGDQPLLYAFRESSFAPAALLRHGRKFPS